MKGYPSAPVHQCGDCRYFILHYYKSPNIPTAPCVTVTAPSRCAKTAGWRRPVPTGPQKRRPAPEKGAPLRKNSTCAQAQVLFKPLIWSRRIQRIS